MTYDAAIHIHTIMGISRLVITVHEPERRTLNSPPVLRLAFDTSTEVGDLAVEDWLRDVLVEAIEHL